MRIMAADALRHPFIRQDDSSTPSPRIIIDEVTDTDGQFCHSSDKVASVFHSQTELTISV